MKIWFTIDELTRERYPCEAGAPMGRVRGNRTRKRVRDSPFTGKMDALPPGTFLRCCDICSAYSTGCVWLVSA